MTVKSFISMMKNWWDLNLIAVWIESSPEGVVVPGEIVHLGCHITGTSRVFVPEPGPSNLLSKQLVIDFYKGTIYPF